MKDLLQRKYANYVLKPFLQWYLKKDRYITINGFDMRVSTGVFHPSYFFSSTYFAEFISKLDLKNKNLLDLGCGSGILSLTAYKNGANVVAVDISTTAVNDTKFNFTTNFKTQTGKYKIIQSDLFSSLEQQIFDVIVINPPYFFKAAQNDMEMAWNCGERGEYFTELFEKLNVYSGPNSQIYMILAENCEIDRIQRIAASSNFKLEVANERKIKWEHNFIYKLKSTVA